MAVAVAGYVGVSMVVADRLTKPYRRPLASSPAALGLAHEDVTFSSTVDGTTLRGWFMPAEGSDRAVLVVHGRSSSRTRDNGEQVAQAAALVDGGYNVLRFDFRAHGLSDGARCTLGADEQGDVLGISIAAGSPRTDWGSGRTQWARPPCCSRQAPRPTSAPSWPTRREPSQRPRSTPTAPPPGRRCGHVRRATLKEPCLYSEICNILEYGAGHGQPGKTPTGG